MTNYIEPFFGSGAVLFARPTEPKIETVNDIDGFICNFWRAIQADPDQVAHWADWPVIESDLEARHAWLIGHKTSLAASLADPDWFDAKIAGWWVWGISCWIGSGWCSGKGKWQIAGGQFVEVKHGSAHAIQKHLIHLGCGGKGIHAPGIARKRPNMAGDNGGKGVIRQLPHLHTHGQGIHRQATDLQAYFHALSARLRRVRVACGNWTRVTGPAVTTGNGVTGVFLDPPYLAATGRDMGLYSHDSAHVARDVRQWAIANGGNPMLRIALCGYQGEHTLPDGWTVHEWNAGKGYAGRNAANANGKKERIWFSPHCLGLRQASLFEFDDFHSRDGSHDPAWESPAQPEPAAMEP